jgi:hypothetical protein
MAENRCCLHAVRDTGDNAGKPAPFLWALQAPSIADLPQGCAPKKIESQARSGNGLEVGK